MAGREYRSSGIRVSPHQLELHAADREHAHSSSPAGLFYLLGAQPDAEELETSKSYLDRHGSNYWDDLVMAEEKSNERYLGKIGRSHWMTAFAPMGVAGDVLAVMEEARSTLELNKRDLVDVATGLTKVMAEYDQMGIYSFNMNFFNGTKTDDHSAFICSSHPALFQPETGDAGHRRLAQPVNETCAWPTGGDQRL